MVIPEHPQIHDKDRVEQRRFDHDRRPGEERERNPPEDQSTVEAGTA